MSWAAMLYPLLRRLPPELSHELAIEAIASGLAPKCPPVDSPMLHTTLAGLALPNPVGIAAGFDKNARTLAHIFSQGIGFMECGTVTPLAQPGNPRPRVFRLSEHAAVINRLGFNNKGMDAFVQNLQQDRKGVVGANIGKNKTSDDAIADYVVALKAVYPHADYITVNISSPNTQGLRDLQRDEALGALIDAVHDARAGFSQRKPVFVKIAPDLDDVQLAAIAAIALDKQLDGLIVSNTTIARPDAIGTRWKDEAGGLSGRPLFEPSTQILRRIYQLTEGKIPLIGVGGISSAEDAYAKIKAGASAVQLYTALVYQGPVLIERINRGLIELLTRDGYAKVSEAVGAAA